MKKSSKHSQAFRKVVNETYLIPKKRGGGMVKMEAWEDQNGKVVKYSLAYINPFIFADDNGRVLGYDNIHAYHPQTLFRRNLSCGRFHQL